MIVTLTGFMGSGKSCVGRKLSARLSAAFIDLDDYITKKAGCSIPEIFAKEGEEGFRSRESGALVEVLDNADALGEKTSLVLSLGGGTITRDRNAQPLQERTTIIFLRAKKETLEARLANGKDKRPLLQQGNMAALLEQRTPIYEKYSDIILDTDGMTPSEVASLIEESLKYFKKEDNK